MVLTRAGKNRLLALGVDENMPDNMENIPSTSTVPTMTTSAPTTSMVNAPAASGAADMMSIARTTNPSSDSNAAHITVTTPDYSSITARNIRQEDQPNVGLDPPPRGIGADQNANTVDSLRNEFSRQMQDLQRSLQEIARTVGQQMGQTAMFHGNAPVPANTPLQPLTGDFFDGAPDPGVHNGSYTQHFRPVREPQYAPVFGRNSSPFNTRPDPYHSPGSRVDLSKWGIKFDGTHKTISAEDFMFRLDVLRQDYGCSFSDILRSFHLLLEGQALDWYWNVRKLTPIRNWQDLETAFLTQYRRFESEFQIQKKIMDRRQLPQESFEDFYNAVIRLRNQQRNPYSEKELVEIMRSNLKPALTHLLFSVRLESLNEFCQQAKRAESLLFNQRHQGQYRTFPAQRVNGLEYGEPDLGEDNPEVEALGGSGTYTCWNCKQKGHSFIDCPSPNRRVFCYRCGRDGVVTPKCPRCQGNLAKSKSYSGETRSTQT